MKIALDTNVLLDVVLRRGKYQESLKLAFLIAKGEADGLISANSITDIYYIARKSIGDDKAREAVADLMAIFDVAPIDGDTCATALYTPMSDYEDAVLAVCAANAGAEYVVTRDEWFLSTEGSPVQAIRPSKAIEILMAKDSDI